MSVYVWIEQFNGKAAPASWEALGKGRELADALGGSLTALVFGQGVDDLAAQAFHYGADQVIAADDATLAQYRLEPYAALLNKVVSDGKPQVVLAGATNRGRELMAAAALDVDAALLSDVLELALDGDTLRGTRSVFGGKLLSTVEAPPDGPRFATLRVRAFKAPAPDTARTGDVTHVDPVLAEDAIGMKITGFDEATGEVSLTDASIIVSGGRAVGSAEGFVPVRALAEVLGGAVGASRAAVDAGYIPYEHQVGQTGKVVSPDLYIACGISGAIQHQAGMRTSKVIVAINTDPEAPIFKLAHYGIVDDMFKVLPALTEEFKKRLGK
ncbi:MAG: electron transfer flavoprotein subunit alpha/FixB family protein [Anaerolineae bacterium]